MQLLLLNEQKATTMKLSEFYWHRITPLHFLLWPLSVLFSVFMQLRRLCYWLDIFPSVKLSVPVIVVDSITTDDGGKTPLILWLVEFLQTRGFHPGIVTRGYSDNPGTPMAVTSKSDYSVIGEKIILLAKRTGDNCPIWVGDDRATVAQALLDANPTCNIIICNDGLHYHRLERDIEITVTDFSEHSFGNGLLLPAGPLRERLDRLQNVDAVIINGKQLEQLDSTDWAPTFNMRLVSETIYNVTEASNCQLVSDLKGQRIHAVANFDNSDWFFDYVQHSGLNAELHSLPEHHHFSQQDLQFPETEAVLMPEEIAIQYAIFSNGNVWALPVEAWVNNELQSLIDRKLNGKQKDGKKVVAAPIQISD